MNQTYELLVVWTKEVEEDIKEIKFKLKQTHEEISDLDQKILIQE